MKIRVKRRQLRDGTYVKVLRTVPVERTSYDGSKYKQWQYLVKVEQTGEEIVVPQHRFYEPRLYGGMSWEERRQVKAAHHDDTHFHKDTIHLRKIQNWRDYTFDVGGLVAVKHRTSARFRGSVPFRNGQGVPEPPVLWLARVTGVLNNDRYRVHDRQDKTYVVPSSDLIGVAGKIVSEWWRQLKPATGLTQVGQDIGWDEELWTTVRSRYVNLDKVGESDEYTAEFGNPVPEGKPQQGRSGLSSEVKAKAKTRQWKGKAPGHAGKTRPEVSPRKAQRRQPAKAGTILKRAT